MTSLPVEYTDKKISPWGGLIALELFFRKCGLREQIRKLNWQQPGSGRGILHYELIESFMVSSLLGAKRFSESSALRFDTTVQEMFGWKDGMADQSTLSRFFRKYDQESSDEMFTALNRWWFDQIKVGTLTLDIDSTVITRFGKQEGVKKGYNARYKGRGSHHPLMAFIPELKMVANSWMRPGNSTSSSDFELFLEQTLDMVPKERIGLVRADSGFCGDNVLFYLEKQELHYVIAMKLNGSIASQIIAQKGWLRARDGLEYCSFEYQAQGWKAGRRLVVVRKDTGKLPHASGRTLFSEYDQYGRYRYSVFVTNTRLSASMVWDLYRHRAEAENQIKELKEDFGLDGFASSSMDATEFAFRWVTVSYNLMSLYKIMVLRNKIIPRQSTLRYNCIAIGAYLVRSSRKTRLKLSVQGKKRDFMDRLFQNLDEYKLGMPIPIA